MKTAAPQQFSCYACTGEHAAGMHSVKEVEIRAACMQRLKFAAGSCSSLVVSCWHRPYCSQPLELRTANSARRRTQCQALACITPAHPVAQAATHPVAQAAYSLSAAVETGSARGHLWQQLTWPQFLRKDSFAILRLYQEF